MPSEDLNSIKNDLLIKISQADEKAFKELFEASVQKLVHFAFSIVKLKDVAEDIVDETFIRLWQNRENLANIRNIKVYLYTAVKNAALNYISRKAAQQITEPFTDIDILISDEHLPDRQMITAELFKKIHEVVNALPPRCKMIFKLVREDDLKYEEVANILNISKNTVDAQMVIAVKRIREKIYGDLSLRQFTLFQKK